MSDPVGARVSIRPVALEDAEELAAVYAANRAFLAPFEPIRDDAFFTAEGQRAAHAASPGNRHAFAIVVEGRIVGTVTLSNVARGAFESCTMGYWVAEAWNGRGVATAAALRATRYAFDVLGLHRVEAGTLVHNIGSQRVLERAGFARFGLAPRLVRIAGSWQDHVVFQRLSDDPAPPGEPSGWHS